MGYSTEKLKWTLCVNLGTSNGASASHTLNWRSSLTVISPLPDFPQSPTTWPNSPVTQVPIGQLLRVLKCLKSARRQFPIADPVNNFGDKSVLMKRKRGSFFCVVAALSVGFGLSQKKKTK